MGTSQDRRTQEETRRAEVDESRHSLQLLDDRGADWGSGTATVVLPGREHLGEQGGKGMREGGKERGEIKDMEKEGGRGGRKAGRERGREGGREGGRK